jgi:hypothetical protein
MTAVTLAVSLFADSVSEVNDGDGECFRLLLLLLLGDVGAGAADSCLRDDAAVVAFLEHRKNTMTIVFAFDRSMVSVFFQLLLLQQLQQL